jgi:hypothetical protein
MQPLARLKKQPAITALNPTTAALEMCFRPRASFQEKLRQLVGKWSTTKKGASA